jgi:hypothetical protein
MKTIWKYTLLSLGNLKILDKILDIRNKVIKETHITPDRFTVHPDTLKLLRKDLYITLDPEPGVLKASPEFVYSVCLGMKMLVSECILEDSILFGFNDTGWNYEMKLDYILKNIDTGKPRRMLRPCLTD